MISSRTPIKFNGIAIPVYTYNQGLSTKYSVNLVLFYMNMKKIGTDRHHKWIEAVRYGQELGFFAITELSHGSNVHGIQTAATFDKDTDEFVINTQNDMAMKL